MLQVRSQQLLRTSVYLKEFRVMMLQRFLLETLKTLQTTVFRTHSEILTE